jgi:hypothetical protein
LGRRERQQVEREARPEESDFGSAVIASRRKGPVLTVSRLFLGLLAVVLATSHGGTARAATPAPSASPPAGAAAGGGFANSALMGGPQSYATFVKTAERQSGLIDILKKDDDIYFDLGPEQFDRPYIVAPVLASGVGGFTTFAGRIFPTFLIEFHRVGKRVLWVDKNSFFSAPENSAAANALAISVTDSVINSTPITAEDEKLGRVVISAGFFLSDFENVGKALGNSDEATLFLGGSSRPTYGIDPARSYIERTKALPANDEILANLAFVGPPSDDIDSAPDARGVRLRMHYSIVDPPSSSSYVPRLADDRVGYFISAQKRFDNDAAATPFVRYIDRWNFNNGPVVYYLTNEIPPQYKPAIRKALLEWNVAFAKVGIPNAVEVRDQPDDPAWDPDDARYSTVRWITSDQPSFTAIGPSIADPRTGEILRVEIVIDGEDLRAVKRGFADVIAPARSATLDPNGFPAAYSQHAEPACEASGQCDSYEEDSAQMASMGTLALRAAGATPEATDRYTDEYLQSVVLHESGHNFGLRHNFIASTLYSLAQIHDPNFTRDHGIVGSVMGYAPVNISAPGHPQGAYFQLRLGPYDEWAIRYGYERFPNVSRPEDEIVRLHGIADEGSRPEYAYETDEDADGPIAIDPRVARWALSNDPLAFDRNQLDVVANLLGKLDTSFPAADQPYSEERLSFLTIMYSYEQAVMLATKYIGGIYTSRDHRGQPGAEPPTRPVPRDTARRAFALLAENVFSSHALHFSPKLMADLAPSHYLHRGIAYLQRPDFPVAEYAGAIQDDVMFAMFSPEAMSRLADESLKAPPGETMTIADLFGWMQDAVWDDLRPNVATIDPVHRALQRRYANLLIAFNLAPSFVVNSLGYPNDTVPMARYELRRLSARIDAALRSQRLDVATRAHLEDLQTRAHHALEPNATRGT